jgi:hypothetical protein
LHRPDGSDLSIYPDEKVPGFGLVMLKSLGNGKGVYMSKLTSDSLSIYQSAIGNMTLGNDDGDFGLVICDRDNIPLTILPTSGK